ncbi:MAG: LuxR C-terminal-related transcriptional regulator [Idiomarina sp.]
MTPIILAVSSGLVRAGMEHVLAEQSNYQICASIGTFNELRQIARDYPYATVVLCSQLSGDATIESWRRLVKRYPDLLLLLWGRNFQDVLDFQCSISQVDAYLLEHCSCQELLDAMASIRSGQMYVASAVAEYFARNPRKQEQRQLFEQLSEREMQVTQMLGRGIRVAEIAKHLNISTKTVNTFRYRIFDKLGISGDVALSHVAIRAGIVDIMNLET